MFEQLFRATDTVEQYQAAALAESRLRYLRHWLKVGSQTLDSAHDCHQSA